MLSEINVTDSTFIMFWIWRSLTIHSTEPVTAHTYMYSVSLSNDYISFAAQDLKTK
jgi:hypothetical protein